MTIIETLTAAVEKAGTQTAFARQHGVSLAYVNDVLQGRREAGDKILTALGLRKIITYEPIRRRP